METLYFAADHAGVKLKNSLIDALKKSSDGNDLQIADLGTHSEESCDYPLFAKKIADTLRIDKNARGVLICGMGIGMSIAANRFLHIRAALCCNKEMAEYSRRHNDANVLVFGAKIISHDLALECIKIFLSAGFDGDRHERRLNLINGMNDLLL